MTTPVDPPEIPDEEFDALASMLSSAAVWDDPAPGIEDSLVAEITGEIADRPHAPAAPGRSDRRALRLLGAVAVLFLVSGVLIGILVGSDDDDGSVVVALAGTELAPAATADAELEVLFDIGEGTLERIAGGKALFSISARAQEEEGQEEEAQEGDRSRGDRHDAPVRGRHLAAGDERRLVSPL